MVTIIAFIAAAVAAVTPTNGQKQRRRRPDSDDPVLDGYRLKQERARLPGWLDQKMELRNANSFANYWF
jgi:hypothetical protein